MDEHALAARAWPDVAGDAVVLVPIGSTEQHGPHLPVSTDARIAAAVAHAAAARLAGSASIIVAPSLAYGSSGEHEHFAGTISIGAEALRVVVIELARSLRRWARLVVLVNGHGGNVAVLDDAVRQLRDEGHAIAWTSCSAPGGDAHAGRSETSIMLHLDPSVVGEDRPVGATDPIGELLPRLMAGGVAAVSKSGVLGDARGASREEGERMVEAMVQHVTDRVRAALEDVA